MNAELLSVGTELLLGEIVNTDAQFLGEELSSLGINVYYQTVVGDNKERLTNALKMALSRADIVITSGGLGPTPDDLTKEVIAECMGKKLVFDQSSYDSMAERFARVGRHMTENNKKQAMLPEGCIILQNHHGTAPGCIIEEHEKVVVMLPGPPSELTKMYLESVKPYLRRKTDHILYSRVYRMFGVGESAVAQKLAELMETSQNPTVAPYAKTGEVHLRVTAACKDEQEGERIVGQVDGVVRKEFDEYIYSTNGNSIAEESVRLLTENGCTVSAAESCTGGLFAKQITDIPGTSSVLGASFITYSNAAKTAVLEVSEQTLREHGAVSPETAREMAEGARKKSGADFGIGITGIAGPDGGSDEKPVGLVYVALADGQDIQVKELRLNGNRDAVRSVTCMHAFDLLRRKILEKI